MDEEFDTSVDTSDVDTSADMDTSDVVDDVPDDIPEDVPEDIPEDIPEDEPEAIEEDDLSEDIPEDLPEDEPEAIEEDDLSEDIPEDVPEDEPEMMEEDDLSDDVPEDLPEDEPEAIEEDDLSEDIPEDVPEDEPEMIEEDDLSDDIPEDVPEEQVETDDTTTDDTAEDTTSDVDSADSTEPIEETQDELLDDTTTEETAEDTTSDVDSADSTEPIEEIQDEPTDDTATEDDAEDTASEVDSTDSTKPIDDTQDEPMDDTATDEATEDATSDVDSGDSTEPTEDTQDEPLDDTATEETAEDTTTDVDSGDTTEPTDDTRDEPADDTATEDTAEDTTSDVDNGDSTEPIEDTQDELLDDTATEETAEDSTSDVDSTDSAEPTEETQDEPMDDTATEETAEDSTSDVDSTDSAEPTEDTQDEPLDDSTTDEYAEGTSSDMNDCSSDEHIDTQQKSADDTNEFNGGIQDAPSKVLKRDELDLLKSGNDAINQRLEAQADNYRDKGMSEAEIRDRLAADKWNFQKEFLEDAFPGQDVSPNVFNGLSENGAKDRIADIENSDTLRNQLKSDEANNALDGGNSTHKWDEDESGLTHFADTKALARGEVADYVFNNEDVDDINKANLKLEDLSKNDYENLKQTNPQKASQLLTDYNDRNIMPDDLSRCPRHLDVENNNGLYIVDKDLSADNATMRDVATGQKYSVYPNPMNRVAHMAGQQGQNDLGMHQDCGIASTAKGINDIYGKNVTSENRLANYAYDTHNCSIETKPDASVDIYNSGGTWEGNVKDFYNANGLSADMYVKDNVPSPEYIASRLKNGDVATLAVNHDLMWNWDKAQAFNPANVDANRYATDPRYARHVNDLMKMQNGGVFKADHFVNVSNAVYDKNGALTHFIVSDTGNGTTRMIDKDYLYRAYNGGGKISVTAQGCVIAGRR